MHEYKNRAASERPLAGGGFSSFAVAGSFQAMAGEKTIIDERATTKEISMVGERAKRHEKTMSAERAKRNEKPNKRERIFQGGRE